ncbi:peptidoglycan recognition protein family protein [Nostoc sp. UHCC 0870]|uniref:peptidoglycan recognition protein family protein n=1 Tax=Nostoc sp. UHCC 0870 TaxID=2914041 RepID=UPI001EDE85E8|nr:peptidoglycan recognition family protein [Nostoc sp. UHCC 0870]UKO97068.1 peptidoglycan recognition protein family protein [Nostoc sp. UHCC 0870]
MRFRDWATRVILISLVFLALSVALLIGEANKLKTNTTTSEPAAIAWSPYPQAKLQSDQIIQEKSQNLLKSPKNNGQSRFRYHTTEAFSKYKPRYLVAAVHPSNYGERYIQDANGVPLNNQPIIVIHETSNSASSAVNFFQTPHEDENMQASYHAIITLDGSVIYLVPPQYRAFGAGNSVFEGLDGAETVETNANLPPSVNNFAYHVSLETPPDGRGNNFLKSHSGYTEAQYHSLAWLIAQSQVPGDRITTHKAVDRSGERVDPLSFDFDKFRGLLDTYRQVNPVYSALPQ